MRQGVGKIGVYTHENACVYIRIRAYAHMYMNLRKYMRTFTIIHAFDEHVNVITVDMAM
jgi:hypothetical protein